MPCDVLMGLKATQNVLLIAPNTRPGGLTLKSAQLNSCLEAFRLQLPISGVNAESNLNRGQSEGWYNPYNIGF